MNRRTLLTSISGLAAFGAVGSGAFTSVSAERTVTVDVEDDSDALLKLQEVGDGKRSAMDGGQLELNIPGDNEDQYPSGGSTDPEGVGTDSIYRFSADAGGNPGDGLFKITNQGTQPVDIYGTDGSDADEPSVAMFNVDAENGLTENVLTESDPYESLGTGQTLYCGLQLDTHGVDVQDTVYNVPLTINALADN